MIRSKILKGAATLFFSAFIITDVLSAAGQAGQFVSTKIIEIPDSEIEGWKVFEQTIDSEKVFMNLPDKPAFTRVNDNWGATITLAGKTEYWLMAPVPAMSRVQKEELFPMFMEQYSNKPYKLLESNIKEENGMPVLDMVSQNRKTKKLEHIRVIITEKNFYVASVKYKKSRNQNVQPSLFLESVYVVK